MSILDAVRERRSVREFLSKEIPESLIENLKEALVWAPSAGNLQARKFYFIFDRKKKSKLASAALNQSFIAKAPLVIVGCTDSHIRLHYGERGVHLYTIQDVAASIMGMMLVAHEAGLGSVWVGAFHDDEVSKILELPGNLKPVALVPIGYPSSIPLAPPRVSREHAVETIH
ncbi:MAG: nitroreductase family protein [Thermodesulfovibrionia bacterium]|nr:nitroreductase family protein [Thermodesulfovibrionia bacterium]MCK5511494.1 nitroreductase family protein [Thermodesulfovibrionia bacterium]